MADRSISNEEFQVLSELMRNPTFTSAYNDVLNRLRVTNNYRSVGQTGQGHAASISGTHTPTPPSSAEPSAPPQLGEVMVPTRMQTYTFSTFEDQILLDFILQNEEFGLYTTGQGLWKFAVVELNGLGYFRGATARGLQLRWNSYLHPDVLIPCFTGNFVHRILKIQDDQLANYFQKRVSATQKPRKYMFKIGNYSNPTLRATLKLPTSIM